MKAFFSALWAAFGLSALGDSPITSLTTGTSVGLKTDFIPYVDVADKSQARTGTTKKIAPGSLYKSLSGVVNVLAAGAVGDGVADDTAAINTAMASGYEVVFPTGYTFYIGSAVSVPTNEIVHINGTVTGPGNFVCADSVTFDGGGKVTMTQGSDNRKIKAYSGAITVRDLHFIGTSSDNPSAVVIVSDGAARTVTSLIVEGCRTVNWGDLVAHEGLDSGNVANGSIVKRAIIRGNHMYNTLQGDAITWNATQGTDTDLLIDGNVIDTVNSSSGGYSGFAIGIAGSGGAAANFATVSSDIVIVNNIIRNVRTGIHVEFAKRVKISGNLVYNISTNYSTGSNIGQNGIEVAAIWDSVITDNFVSDVGNDWIGHYFGIASSGGYTNSTYTASVRNNYISRNTLRNASVYLESIPLVTNSNGNTAYELSDPPIMSFEGNAVNNGCVYVKGRGTVTLRNNNISANIAKIGDPSTFAAYALYVDPQFYFGAAFDSRNRALFVIEGNNARDEYGNASFGASSYFDDTGTLLYGNQRTLATGNNFPVYSAHNIANSVNRTHYVNAAALPKGIDLVKGDLIISTNAGYKALVIVSGSSVPASDTYQVYSAATGLINRNTGNANDWELTHMMGQRLTLTYSGGSTNVIMRRLYNDAGAPNTQVIEVVSPTTGGVCNLTGVGSGTITATYPVTVTSY